MHAMRCPISSIDKTWGMLNSCALVSSSRTPSMNRQLAFRRLESIRNSSSAVRKQPVSKPPTSSSSINAAKPSTNPSSATQNSDPSSKTRVKLPNMTAKAANQFVISTLTARPGGGTGAEQSRKGQPLRPGETLPSEYRPAARRIVAIIVALPIAIVTGYLLFERRFMGVERKKVGSGMPTGEEGKS